ncbi:MAG TPA: serine/threonine-protein kinase, partial [Actinomycetota bacterium]|nr:serine/threonine-protein kinase [Actinomycetota bacterium]
MEPVALSAGATFGPYRIERLLGRGGMGEVYLAEHLRLGRKVAIKVLAPALANDEGFRERFLRESQHAASLDHPNIVMVYDAADEGGRAYISMRFVDGPDLSTYLRSAGPLDPALAVGILAQVAAALDAAHADGLVHRDVKPANILLEGPVESDRVPRALLSDFGITKRVGAQGSTTGQFVGTIDYMAPEQITGRQTDGRTDEYSLACVLFQCLTGRVPFPREDQVGVMYAHVQSMPPLIAKVRQDVPPAIDEVVRRGMAKSARQRYGMCAELIDAAAAALEVDAPAPVTWTGPRHSGGHRRLRGGHRGRRVALVAVAAALAVALVAGIALWWPRSSGGPQAGASRTVAPDSPTPSASSSPTPTESLSPSPTQSPLPFPTSIDWRRILDPTGQLGGRGDQTMNRVAT